MSNCGRTSEAIKVCQYLNILNPDITEKGFMVL